MGSYSKLSRSSEEVFLKRRCLTEAFPADQVRRELDWMWCFALSQSRDKKCHNFDSISCFPTAPCEPRPTEKQGAGFVQDIIYDD